MQLIRPAAEHLPSYMHALRQGWSPSNVRPALAREQLQSIERDPTAFLVTQDDPDGKGQPIALPDGSLVPRLPGFIRWMWDGEFCGIISFRWQPGTTALPPHCLGHIGYAVVPWKRRRGYATAALGLMVGEVRRAALEGLDYLEIVTDTTNLASQRVIEANRAVLIERFTKPAVYGGTESLRYRIVLDEGAGG
ncbi:MAG TPA: GNAT family N-acetyltransferase [Longimicrobium sp.]|jgi:predicted acetyltransferase|uniref:GNAT family N-acetyltransferase n=1 Tax=Longimicrobium sp. TaxID=2029185 RepID=UPI002ED7DE6A